MGSSYAQPIPCDITDRTPVEVVTGKTPRILQGSKIRPDHPGSLAPAVEPRHNTRLDLVGSDFFLPVPYGWHSSLVTWRLA